MSEIIENNGDKSNLPALELNSLEIEFEQSLEANATSTGIDFNAPEFKDFMSEHVNPFISRYENLPLELASSVDQWINFYAKQGDIFSASLKEMLKK
jgi:hypothetical protein